MNIGSVIAMKILIINYFSYDNMKECVFIVDYILCNIHIKTLFTSPAG